MNRWLQSRMRVKRVYILVGGGLMILLITLAAAAMFMKSAGTSSDTQTAKQNSSSQAETTASASSENGEETVVRVPLDKTLDEAKADGLYSSSTETHSSSGSMNQSDKSQPAASPSASNGQPGQTKDAAMAGQATADGQGLDANTINQLRGHGIREGDLAKIDRMVAEGLDPKEIAQSLRQNGNPNLAAVMDQVPRKPKKEDKLKKEEKKKDKQEVPPANKNAGQETGDDNKQSQDSSEDDDD